MPDVNTLKNIYLVHIAINLSTTKLRLLECLSMTIVKMKKTNFLMQIVLFFRRYHVRKRLTGGKHNGNEINIIISFLKLRSHHILLQWCLYCYDMLN